ncbi:MAG: hypothetical protein N4A43_02095, partial [Alphaproteobacteria bacterium]|nr:hypothetical protein [Alphaproteobacteria bacterium]
VEGNTASHTGGLTGVFAGKIINSYASGNVNNGGSLVGILYGIIINSYALGTSPLDRTVYGLGGNLDNTNNFCTKPSTCYASSSLQVRAGRDYYAWDDSVWENLNNSEPRLEWEKSGVVNSNIVVPDAEYPNVCSDNPLENMDKDGDFYLIGGLSGDSAQAKNELLCISNTINDSDMLKANYKMTANINFLDNEDWNGDGVIDSNDSKGWKPISVYTGEFDGNNHNIDNLYVNSADDYVGIFGKIIGGQVNNLSLSNIDIKADDYIGGIVGFLHSSNLANITVSGSILGDSFVGLVGGKSTSSSFNNINVSGLSSGRVYIGGVNGSSDYGGSIRNAISSANVKGTDKYIGGISGIAGLNNGFTLENCHNSGVVEGYDYTGGIAGRSYATLTKISNVGNVSGRNYVGGLIGAAGYWQKTTDVYVNAKIIGQSYVGGLMGLSPYQDNLSYITNGYFSGDVTGTNNVGGLFGGVKLANFKLNNVYSKVGSISPVSSSGEIYGVMLDEANDSIILSNGDLCDNNDNYICSDSDRMIINSNWDINVWNDIGTSPTPTFK